MEYLSFAAVSKLFAAGATYPYQVVRARLQDQHRQYAGLIDVVSTTWRLVDYIFSRISALEEFCKTGKATS